MADSKKLKPQHNVAKIPPQSLEAEASVIGAILIDPDAIIKVADAIAPHDFYDKRHEIIFAAIMKLYELHTPIDVLTLSNQLEITGDLVSVGGTEYLSELTNYVPTAANISEYADIVSIKSVRRKLIKSSQEIAELGYDESNLVEDLIEKAEKSIFEVSNKKVKDSIVGIEDILVNVFDRLDDLNKNKGKTRGVTTGFRDLDNIVAGWQPSDLVILAARPSMGKTALSLNFAHNVAKKAQKAVLYFSLEMSKDQIADRLLASEAGVNAWNLRTGNLSDQDFEKISEAMGVLSELKIYIDDTPSISINELRTKARREAHKHEISLIIVDYLQLMSGGSSFAGDFNRTQEISSISRGLKQVARELDVPVIALSQLSRSVESRSPQIPQLSDLRESGSIEQDADIVAFIYREEYYNKETDRKNITDIFIKKHRNGQTGSVSLFFENDKQRFLDLDKNAIRNPFSE